MPVDLWTKMALTLIADLIDLLKTRRVGITKSTQIALSQFNDVLLYATMATRGPTN